MAGHLLGLFLGGESEDVAPAATAEAASVQRSIMASRRYIFTPRGAPQGNRQGNIITLWGSIYYLLININISS